MINEESYDNDLGQALKNTNVAELQNVEVTTLDVTSDEIDVDQGKNINNFSIIFIIIENIE